MKVWNAEPEGYSKYAIESWTKKGYTYIAASWEELKDTDGLSDVEILIVRLGKKIDRTVLDYFPSLKYIISATTGHDHIDIEALKQKGIQLVSLRGHHSFLNSIPSTAEHTWALLLALIKKIPAARQHVKAGGWNRDAYRGMQLKNKMLGIIGLGRTGNKIAAYGKAFEMQIQYFDPFVEVEGIHKCVHMEQLLNSSDIISLHVHLNEETENLLGSHNIHQLKSGCLIINTSRGKILDEIAIVQALKEGNIAGIAADVLSTEMENIKTSPLWKAMQENENILITPHIGGASRDAMWACEEYLTSEFCAGNLTPVIL